MSSLERSPRRARKFAAKREAVLDAAMAIVIADGLAGLTLGKVAKALDVAVGGLYRYFPSKEELVVGLQVRAIARFGERLDAHVPAEPRSNGPVVLLRHVLAPFYFYARNALDDADEHRLMDVMLSNLDPSLTDAQAHDVELVLGPVLARAQASLDLAARAGALASGDSRARTLLLWSGTHGLGHLRSRDRLEAEAHRSDALLDALFESLLIGFGAEPKHARQAARRK